MVRIGFLSELVQYLETPWARQGLVANLHSQIRCSPMHPGLKRKSRRICISKSEELERKARFLARSAKKAPKFRITNRVFEQAFKLYGYVSGAVGLAL
jgi:hypothetical protein